MGARAFAGRHSNDPGEQRDCACNNVEKENLMRHRETLPSKRYAAGVRFVPPARGAYLSAETTGKRKVSTLQRRRPASTLHAMSWRHSHYRSYSDIFCCFGHGVPLLIACRAAKGRIIPLISSAATALGFTSRNAGLVRARGCTVIFFLGAFEVLRHELWATRQRLEHFWRLL